ncbi:hypothetical protein QF015_003280 [Paenarthrobacter sp. TE4293]|uniref:HNH endonuclease signature motif containing protein n=1 Tax=Paenarthrobacter sp. TE4293 TaxID=3381695 RepID=UPI003D1FC2F9
MGSGGQALASRAVAPGDDEALPGGVAGLLPSSRSVLASGSSAAPEVGSKGMEGAFVSGVDPSRELDEPLDEAYLALTAVRVIAISEARTLGFVEAADFAGRVEEIARTLEYLQVVAAQAVERTRTEAQQAGPGSSAAAPGWRTGWTESKPGSNAPATAQNRTGTATAPVPTGGERSTSALPTDGARPKASVVDDGYRNAAQFLRARLRIGIGEARRRLALAREILPQTGMTGQDIPARREVLAHAVGSALVPSRSATIISTALDNVKHLTDDDTLTRMEHALTSTAIETDPDFVTTMAKRWTDVIDHDGSEPSEEVLRQLQGVFLRRRRRHGLHHLEIFATDEQFETLSTVMNTATNPRLQSTGQHGTGPDLDRRSRPQKLLDGLVGACSLAMTTGKLPSNGGLRPQLTITIDERHLFNQLAHHSHHSRADHHTDTGTATFTGPIHPSTIRKIACDADIIPVLLGSDSRILDIGRTTRIFPPHIRKAITARDGGCAFPDCTMPAPWCEAHHTTYWSHGGTTSTDNGTLLCSHHHHLIHKENWHIDMTTGVPWFIPPPHIDPHQKPRRNHHHTPHRTPENPPNLDMPARTAGNHHLGGTNSKIAETATST